MSLYVSECSQMLIIVAEYYASQISWRVTAQFPNWRCAVCSVSKTAVLSTVTGRKLIRHQPPAVFVTPLLYVFQLMLSSA